MALSRKLYLLPGLGADPRIFRGLVYHQNIEVIALPWIAPGESKTLGEYACLLHEYYRLESPYWLGGVSLGGMLAQEWARLQEPRGLVLISTAMDRNEIAGLIRGAAGLNVGPLLRKPGLVKLGLIGDLFTSKSEKGRALFKQMLHDSDADFLEFGARAILKWKSPGVQVPYLRVHGTNDRIFPWKAEMADVNLPSRVKKIRGGNHFMIFDHGKAIGRHISDFMLGINPVQGKL